MTPTPHPSKVLATPFVKWAGGKRSLMGDIAQHFPQRIGRYWEPFVGGGAVFFTMAERIDHAILSDKNEALILAYQMVKDRVDDLIEVLRMHERRHRHPTYYRRVRAQQPTEELEIAARLIYLNKTCYNGLYRVNKKGRFNVPKGRYKNPRICDAEGLRSASHVLAKATLCLGDFERRVRPQEGDFIYCDPPYDGCFTDYQSGGFTDDDQERLCKTICEWTEAKAKVMLSNANTPLIRHLYSKKDGFTLHKAKAPRPINSRATGRGTVAELIIISYD